MASSGGRPAGGNGSSRGGRRTASGGTAAAGGSDDDATPRGGSTRAAKPVAGAAAGTPARPRATARAGAGGATAPAGGAAAAASEGAAAGLAAPAGGVTAGGATGTAGGYQPGRAAGSAPSPIPTTRRGMFRYRVLPRSVIGLSMLILSFAIGAGFSGVVLYSYYQYRLDQTNTRVNTLIDGYKGQFAKAQADLKATVANASSQVSSQLKAAQALQVGPSQLAALTKELAPSVFFVHTLDASGQPSVGSAFVISSSASQSLLITSYTTVAAATRSPGPPVYVRQGGTDTQLTVRTWDPQYDLALLVLPRGGLKALTAAPTSPAPQPGDRLFAVSGLGTAGASITQGFVVDASTSGLVVDTAIGTSFQGGPVVNQKGQVVAVGSRTYAPLGFTSSGAYYVPYVEAACSKVLSCPGGSLVGSH